MALNFPGNFIHWIHLFITISSFSIQVIGEIAGFFTNKRGLRQGFALSPYLFVICMIVLSYLIDKATIEKWYGYHPRCKNVQMTHLCFADDLMVFIDGQKRSIEGVLSIFYDCERFSRLDISLEKSTLFLAGCFDQLRDSIISSFILR